jgi:hypothetical protein
MVGSWVHGNKQARSMQISRRCMLKNISYANLQLLFFFGGKIHQILISQNNYYEFIKKIINKFKQPWWESGRVWRTYWEHGGNIWGNKGDIWEHELVFARAISMHHGGGMVGTQLELFGNVEETWYENVRTW